jgi:hypothetical protein
MFVLFVYFKLGTGGVILSDGIITQYCEAEQSVRIHMSNFNVQLFQDVCTCIMFGSIENVIE